MGLEGWGRRGENKDTDRYSVLVREDILRCLYLVDRCLFLANFRPSNYWMNASYKEYTERYTLFLSKAYFISFREILSLLHV